MRKNKSCDLHKPNHGKNLRALILKRKHLKMLAPYYVTECHLIRQIVQEAESKYEHGVKSITMHFFPYMTWQHCA